MHDIIPGKGEYLKNNNNGNSLGSIACVRSADLSQRWSEEKKFPTRGSHKQGCLILHLETEGFFSSG